MALMLQIMSGLQELCGELVLPQSDKLAKVGSLEVSVLASSPSKTLEFEESGDVDGVRATLADPPSARPANRGWRLGWSAFAG
jgi:hypothetical protein